MITVFAAQTADYFEEMFKATGSRGGFMSAIGSAVRAFFPRSAAENPS
ncbi:MAG: hypothetical protein WA709_22345 [Stellaceae bacterium]